MVPGKPGSPHSRLKSGRVPLYYIVEAWRSVACQWNWRFCRRSKAPSYPLLTLAKCRRHLAVHALHRKDAQIGTQIGGTTAGSMSWVATDAALDYLQSLATLFDGDWNWRWQHITQEKEP